MHLCDPENGILGSTAIVGGGNPHCCWYCACFCHEGYGYCVGSFFGDGAMDEGTFHESMNFASLKNYLLFFYAKIIFMLRTRPSLQDSRMTISQ